MPENPKLCPRNSPGREAFAYHNIRVYCQRTNQSMVGAFQTSTPLLVTTSILPCLRTSQQWWCSRCCESFGTGPVGSMLGSAGDHHAGFDWVRLRYRLASLATTSSASPGGRHGRSNTRGPRLLPKVPTSKSRALLEPLSRIYGPECFDARIRKPNCRL
jgi:hypothetical protein